MKSNQRISTARLFLLTMLAAATVTARAAITQVEPVYVNINVMGVGSLLQHIEQLLPENTDNREAVSDFSNRLTLNSDADALPLGFLDGGAGSYLTYRVSDASTAQTITVEDNFTEESVPVSYYSQLKGFRLPGLYDDITFSEGTTIEFHLTKDGRLLLDDPCPRVIVFTIEEMMGAFVCCEEGDDWDYRDRVFWIYAYPDDISAEPMAATLTLADDTDVAFTLADALGQERNVVLANRTLCRDGSWNTLCLPFSLTDWQIELSPLAGATIMTLRKSGLNRASGTLILHFEEATDIVAGQPYIVRWSNAEPDLASPVFWNVGIDRAEPSSVATTFVDFQGCFSATTQADNAPSTLWLDGASSPYYPDAGMSIGACSACFRPTSALDGQQPLAFVMNFGEEITTRIASGKPGASDAHRATWDVAGRRLSGSPAWKGIYLKNGRKIVKP